MDELKRRALLGSWEAQKQCTEAGIVLPCWRCGGESEIQELHTGGKPIYAVMGGAKIVDGTNSGKPEFLDIWDYIAHSAYVARRYDFWVFFRRTGF